MNNRIFNNWTWMRTVFLLIGAWVIVNDLEGEWIGIILGVWPAAMGFFAFGCASGNCATGNCDITPVTKHKQ